MIPVKLYVHDGEGFVAEVQIPPFIVPYEILMWGERFFALREEITDEDGLLLGLKYAEVDCYAVPIFSQVETS